MAPGLLAVPAEKSAIKYLTDYPIEGILIAVNRGRCERPTELVTSQLTRNCLAMPPGVELVRKAQAAAGRWFWGIYPFL